LASLTRSERILGMYTWANAGQIQSLFKEPLSSDGGADLIRLLDRYKNLDDASAMMQVDQHYDLLSLNLTYTDRLSMAASVEARVPILDFELVRVMNSLPPNLKIRGNTGKFILKEAMKTRLPREVVYREKAGFSLPIRSWLRTESEMMRHYFDPERIALQGIFNPIALQAICESQQLGQGDHSNLLFSMLCIQVWMDDQLSAPGRAQAYVHG
jgi:asparagine synthase (glutamine-hydrolysing)